MKKCKDCVNYNLYWFGNYICRKRGVVIGKESISCAAFEPKKPINSWKTGEEKKKPINDKYGYLVCPWCKKTWDADTEWSFRNNEFKFCPLCGNEIDTDGIEEE